MDLLVEKLDGSRYYLSQYKVLITDFEESAPSVTRNSTQLDQRNGSIDFGGWHTDKTINITGYYRADDIDEEETLREKLYALLSDPDGYYITQLKTTPSVAMERPGQTSGGYYDKLSNYPSHKRFLVYTEAPEMELVGNVNGTLLYKLTAEFKTMKLPYGESVPRDLDVKPNVPYYGRNLLPGTNQGLTNWTFGAGAGGQHVRYAFDVPNGQGMTVTTTVAYTNWFWLGYRLNYTALKQNTDYVLSFWAKLTGTGRAIAVRFSNGGAANLSASFGTTTLKAGVATKVVLRATTNDVEFTDQYLYIDSFTMLGSIDIWDLQLVEGTSASDDWSPAPEDPGYNQWYLDTYYNTDNLAIPYAGTVPCNQLEQGFAIEFTAKEASSSLSFKIDDTELTYSGAVAAGDVFMFSGFSYTQNGLSIVSETNKAYFVLQPDKPNRITCNVHGTVRIIGFQNLYA